jgi:hypothetical protein
MHLIPIDCIVCSLDSTAYSSTSLETNASISGEPSGASLAPARGVTRRTTRCIESYAISSSSLRVIPLSVFHAIKPLALPP